MRQSFRLLIAASITVAAMGVVGCQSVPEQDMPGGILGGNDFDRQQQAHINSVDRSLTGAGPDSANPTAAAAPMTPATKPSVAKTAAPTSGPGSASPEDAAVPTPANNVSTGAATAPGAPATPAPAPGDSATTGAAGGTNTTK